MNFVDVVKTVVSKDEPSNYIIANLKDYVFFELSSEYIMPMLPLYNEVGVNDVLYDGWEIITNEEFVEKYEQKCIEIQNNFFNKFSKK